MSPFVLTALALVGTAVTAALGLAAWVSFAPRRTPEGQPPLARLDASSLVSFRADFNSHAGGTRVVALLSPT